MQQLESGYELIEDFLADDQLYSLANELQLIGLPAKVGGIRNAEKKFSSVRDLALSSHMIEKSRAYLTGTPSLVRAILFNKTTNNNWLVAWHQDKTVAVSKKIRADGGGPWSIKDGVHHVQPPIDVLNEMITFRVHIDDTNRENGCLKVLPNSHAFGILDQGSIRNYAQTCSPVFCEAKAGSALVMRPHILHASSKALQPAQRRVLHLEYSSFKLPSGTTWA